MTWVKILRIVREHKDETVNIVSKNSYRQFFSYKKRQNSTFLAFAKILSIERETETQRKLLSLSLSLSSLSLSLSLSL